MRLFVFHTLFFLTISRNEILKFNDFHLKLYLTIRQFFSLYDNVEAEFVFSDHVIPAIKWVEECAYYFHESATSYVFEGRGITSDFITELNSSKVILQIT